MKHLNFIFDYNHWVFIVCLLDIVLDVFVFHSNILLVHQDQLCHYNKNLNTVRFFLVLNVSLDFSSLLDKVFLCSLVNFFHNPFVDEFHMNHLWVTNYTCIFINYQVWCFIWVVFNGRCIVLDTENFYDIVFDLVIMNSVTFFIFNVVVYL